MEYKNPKNLKKQKNAQSHKKILTLSAKIKNEIIICKYCNFKEKNWKNEKNGQCASSKTEEVLSSILLNWRNN